MADAKVQIRNVELDNVDSLGFFCLKSKPKSKGYQRKLAWLRQRLEEGLRIKILYDGARSVAFIEYVPGRNAWRALNAQGFMVIHCLWVVGKAKGKGYGSRLLKACVEDARLAGHEGVAMLTSGGTWLAGKELFLKHGFEMVDTAPPKFELVALNFGDAPSPALPRDWEERARSFGGDLTVVYTGQCPYIDGSLRAVQAVGQELGLEVEAIELTTSDQVRRTSPSPYGVFSILYRGEVVSYHPLGKRDLLGRLSK